MTVDPELPRYVPVVVVGGGMMGLSTAYWLAKHGAEVLLIERKRVAGGASGKNAGIIAYGPLDEYLVTVRRAGRSAARELTEISLENRKLLTDFLIREGIDARYSACGFLSLATSKEELRLLEESSRFLREDGFETQPLDHAGCEETIGTRLGKRFLAGTWSSHDGSLDPDLYISGLACAAQKAGVRISANTDLIDFWRNRGPWNVRTSAGIVTTPHLVLATNEETATLLPALRGAFRIIVNTIILTTPATGLIKAGWAANRASEYGRQYAAGNLIIGGFELDTGLRLSSSEVSVDLRFADLLLRNYLRNSFPELTDLRTVRTWSGRMAFHEDGLPLVGAWPTAPGLWLITGFGGQGLPFSQAMPARLAQAIAGGALDALPVSCGPLRLLSRSSRPHR